MTTVTITISDAIGGIQVSTEVEPVGGPNTPALILAKQVVDIVDEILTFEVPPKSDVAVVPPGEH